MTKIFISPFQNDTNEYINLIKEVLRATSPIIEPLAVKSMASRRLFEYLSKENILIFHWPENRIFPKSGGTASFSFRGFTEWLLLLFLAKFSRGNSVYFVHNHSVHDSTALIKKLSTIAIGIFSASCTTRVVHDPTSTEKYKAIYLPHPLYQEKIIPGWKKPSNPTITYGLIGAIRPYKNIDSVLENWPRDTPLKIRGAGPESYVNKCLEVIKRRNLEDSVSLENRFLSKADFYSELDSVDVLILPHKIDSMLVSGAFFEAIGRTPKILARRTPFIDWASGLCKSVIPFDKDKNIKDAILLASNTNSPRIEEAVDFANHNFGWDTCREAYKQLRRPQKICQ